MEKNVIVKVTNQYKNVCHIIITAIILGHFENFHKDVTWTRIPTRVMRTAHQDLRGLKNSLKL